MKKFLLPTIGLIASVLSAQAQFFTNGNLAVMRISGQAANGSGTTVTGAAMIIDQYTKGGTLANSFLVPTTGSEALLNVGLAYSGLMTLAADNSKLVFAGYHTALPYAPGGMNFATSAAVPRAIGTMDAYGVFNLPIVSATNFSGFTAIGAASDGTNYWASGNGPSGEFQTGLYPQTVYVGTASANTDAQVETNVSSSGDRAINVFFSAGAYGLYACGYATNTGFSSTANGSGGYLLSNISGVLPTSGTGSTNLFPDGSSSIGTGSDLAINPAGTIAYMADSSEGIIRFSNGGSGWVSNYTIVPTNAGYVGSSSKEALSVTADWSQSPPVVYATTAETFTNRLISFSDTGATPTITNLAFGTVTTGSTGATNTFRGVRFVPTVLYGYVYGGPAPFTGAPGETATFSVSVAGSPAPSLQWSSNSPANTNYVAIPGATSASYSLANINTSEGGSLFYVVASNVYGATTSAPAALTVLNPGITVEPMGMTNFPGGGNVTLCVTAVGTGTLTYQWLSNGVPITGAQSACYTVTDTDTINSAAYTVIVSNSLGESATSTATTVSYSPYLINDSLDYPNGNLFVTGNPPWHEISGTSPITETNGRVLMSTSNATGGTAFGQELYTETQNNTVMWASFTLNLKTLPTTAGGVYSIHFEDTNFGFYGRLFLLTSNNPAYTPDVPSTAYPGTYRIGIANKASTPYAVVEQDLAPGIDYHVVEYFDMNGGFTAVAINPSPSDYSSVYNLSTVPTTLCSGYAQDTYSLTGFLPMAGYGLHEATGIGVFQMANLQVSSDLYNGAGSGFTAVAANLTPTPPVIGFVSPGVSNYLGNTGLIEIAASASDATYSWHQITGGVTNQLTDGYFIAGSSSNSLSFYNLEATNAGSYYCVVSNVAGVAVSSNIAVNVNTTPTPPIFTIEPASVTNSLGGTVTFTALAVGTGPITYAWNTDGTPNGATGTSYTLTRITTNMSGNTYSCTATGGAGSPVTSSNATLTVLGPVVTNIAFLRSLQVTNAAPTITVPASNSVQVYEVTATVMEYTNIESATYAEYWIQDSTGGIEFFVTDPTFRPHMGDLVTVTGIVDIFDDALELDGSANNASEPYFIASTNGENEPLPYPAELIPFGFATANPGLSSLVYQGKLGTFTNCYFTTPGATITAGDENLAVTNTAGQMYGLYVSASAGPDLVGQIVPVFAYSITGEYDEFSGSFELNLSAGSNIVSAPPPAVTNLTAVPSSAVAHGVKLSWTAVPTSYTYSIWSTTNLLVPFAPITGATGLWFTNANASITVIASTNTVDTFYQIVSP